MAALDYLGLVLPEIWERGKREVRGVSSTTSSAVENWERGAQGANYVAT
jgi:hypothetical protein